MLISVIIPCFNRSEVILRSVNSVLEQSYQDFELIVVDDGSTDDTFSVLEPLLNHKDGKVKYFKTSNKGVSAARNFGVSKALGDWIAFLDSDDQWHDDKLEKQVSYHKLNPKFSLIHSEELWIRNGKRVNPKTKYKKEGGEIFLNTLSQCVISPSTVLMTRELFLEMGGFREDYEVCEDFDLWLKITSVYPVGFIEEALCSKYGGHADQLSTKFFAMDYWRVKSLFWILNNRRLEPLEIQAVKASILKKSRVLITGYNKHSNLKDLPEIQSIVDSIS